MASVQLMPRCGDLPLSEPIKFERSNFFHTFIAKSWNLSISWCTRWIMRLIVDVSLLTLALSSFTHPAGGPASSSRTLLFKDTSLAGSAKLVEDSARTAEKMLRSISSTWRKRKPKTRLCKEEKDKPSIWRERGPVIRFLIFLHHPVHLAL